ncbi:hypothetical protein EON65_39230 [archaeon]|nr:MAG: hypothetical protein EON65_39230 [archaeon]
MDYPAICNQDLAASEFLATCLQSKYLQSKHVNKAASPSNSSGFSVTCIILRVALAYPTKS